MRLQCHNRRCRLPERFRCCQADCGAQRPPRRELYPGGHSVTATADCSPRTAHSHFLMLTGCSSRASVYCCASVQCQFLRASIHVVTCQCATPMSTVCCATVCCATVHCLLCHRPLCQCYRAARCVRALYSRWGQRLSLTWTLSQ